MPTGWKSPRYVIGEVAVPDLINPQTREEAFIHYAIEMKREAEEAKKKEEEARELERAATSQVNDHIVRKGIVYLLRHSGYVRKRVFLRRR